VVPESERTFGRMLVEQGLVRPEQVDECVAELDRLAREGVTTLPKLGELLARRGWLQSSSIDRTVRPPSSVAPAARPEDGARFTLVRKLGAGGMGEVWEARDAQLQRSVALKFVLAAEPGDVARLKREAQTAARLTHPNIAAVYEVGDLDGRAFIAMQLVQGPSMAGFARTDRRELVRLVRDAAVAVHYAHGQGVIHRDLKPPNLMVENGRVFVMDFGLARRAGARTSLSASGVMVGTPAYMPPEQARGQSDVDARADVYSLGATLYELLGGRPPFSGDEVLDVLTRVCEEEPAPLAGAGDLGTIALKCLEKDRARRYATAQALADDLTRWLEGEPIAARPSSVAYRVRKWVFKRRALSAAAALGVALTAALILYLAVVRPSSRKLAESQRVADEVFAPIRAQVPFLHSNRREMKRVVALLDDALARHPDHWQGWLEKARLHERLGEWEAALVAYEHVTRHNPDFTAAHYRRGCILADILRRPEEAHAAFEAAGSRGDHQSLLTRARQAFDRRQLPECLELCNAVERAGKHVADVRMLRAKAMILAPSTRDLDRATAELTEVIGQEPPSAELFVTRGLVHFVAGRYPKAMDDFTRATELDAGYAPAFANRSAVRYATGDIEGAEADASAALAVDATDPNALLNRATARRALGNLAGAMDDCNTGIDFAADYPLLRVLRGRLRMAAGDTDGAERDFAAAERIGGPTSRLLTARSALKRRLKDLDGALRDADEAVRLAPADDDAYVQRGAAHQSRGDLERAFNDFDQAIRLRPSAEAHFNRGMLRAMRNDVRGAIADYDEAIRLKPRYAEAYLNRASARDGVGDRAGAIADVEKSLEVAPATWPYRATAEKLRRDLGR
jgi:tetratricopeptide (TPR) repeat protein/predicted Ser/Thr protein kinase